MSRFQLCVRARFEAAHHLHSYRGAPEAGHNHAWQVEVELGTDELDSEGIAHDFVPVRASLAELAGRFDHRDINTVPPFDRQNPTAERLAVWFFEELERRLPGAPLASVTVWEGADCSASYRPKGGSP